jgi:integrase
MPTQRITERGLTALKPGEVVWDNEVQGLGARRRREDGRIAFVFKFRSPLDRDQTGRGRQRMLTLGRWGRGDLGIDDARKAATAHRDAVRLGRDPALARDDEKRVMTVSALCGTYLTALPTLPIRRTRRPKKPSTALNDRSRIEAHIKPLLGTMGVQAVTRGDVEAFQYKVAQGKTARRVKTGNRRLSNIRGGQGASARAVGLLGAIFAYAQKLELRPDNPVRGVVRFADKRRERRLSDEEYAALGTGLASAEAAQTWPPAVACARFLALTGWRSGEALALRWSEVDLAQRTALLGDTKTGQSMRPLSRAACELLRDLPRIGSSGLVFPPTRGDGLMSGFRRLWDRVTKFGGLPADVTPHVLRHSFSSIAADLHLSEPTIAALIGHKGHTITSRYVHSADAVLLAAADTVARRIVQLMGEQDPARGEVVELPGTKRSG